MAPLPIGRSEAERELQAYEDEFAILKHTERLRAIAGCDRALEALASAVRAVTSQSPLSDQIDPRQRDSS